MNEHRAKRRWVAALALAVLGLAPATLPAQAEPGSEPVSAAERTTVTPDTIPADATGRLFIHKHLGTPVDQAAYPADGRPIELPGAVVPLPGVVFSVTRINGVDLTTGAGWQAAAQYFGNLDAARQHLGSTVTSARTGADGVTLIDDLPIGLYLVHEVAAYVDGLPDPSVTRSPDFLVTVPMTDPRNAVAWMYDIHVYPKNQRLNITKSVADGNLGLPGQDAPTVGGILSYTINSDIPTGGVRAFGGECIREGRIDIGSGLDDHGFTNDGVCRDGAIYRGTGAGAAYMIIDDLTAMAVPGTDPVKHASDYLEYRAADWSGAITVATVVAAGTVPLVPCADGASPADCDYVLSHEPGRVEISMTDRGLMALSAAVSKSTSTQLQVTLQARVKAAANETVAFTALLTNAETSRGNQICAVLELPNQAVLIPGGWAVAHGVSIPSNTVRTKYGTLRIHKVDQKGGPLTGAGFTLYRTHEDAAIERNELAVSATTDAQGMTQFPALHVTDFQNDTTANDSYWIVETTTPKGYQGFTTPIEVRVLSDGRTAGADASLGYPVVNEKKSGWWPGGLPRTGAMGEASNILALILILGGAGLATLALVRMRRANSSETH